MNREREREREFSLSRNISGIFIKMSCSQGKDFNKG